MTDPRSDARTHTSAFADKLADLRDQLRADIEAVDEPQATALMETAAETLDGLRQAFIDYGKGDEDAWQQ